MAVHVYVTYTPYATSPKEQTGDIITFVQFEEGCLLSQTREDAETMTKLVTNSMTIQLCHHYLA